MPTVVTGIKPTGEPHLGNLIGAIEPALALAERPEMQALYFIADVHALNAAIAPEVVRRHAYEIAAAYLAFGLDPRGAILFRQSDVSEVFELSAILACVCGKGLVNRAHAYKAAVAANRARDAGDDAGINMGLYTYPILMAADILAFDAAVVPIGADQRQHLEIARQLATALNARFGEVVVVPAPIIGEAKAAELPGVDGRKMSKSYGNTVPLFASRDELRARIMRVVTGSSPPGLPVQTAGNVLFELGAPALLPADRDELAGRFAAGASYAELKQLVFERLDARLAGPRERFGNLMQDLEAIDEILDEGATRARRIARVVLARVKSAAGLGPATP